VSKTARLFVISGPSGAGKGTLVSLLRERRPDLGLTVSATTREPREGEIDGVSYHFMTDEEFTRLAEEGAFLEWDGHFDKRYGTLWSEVTPYLEAGKSVILEIDVNGAFNVKKAVPDAVLILITPPSIKVLEERLRSRGSETEEQIALRLERAAEETELSSRYDEILLNDDLERATDQLEALIDSYETDERSKAHVRD